jgi:hypothetical protein
VFENRDPLAVFDDDLLATVAAERDVSVADLRKLVGRHQRRTRDVPGVEERVYDWRSRWPFDPLEVRTDATYYPAIPPGVWEGFGEQMGLDDAAPALIATAHDRQVRRVAAERDHTEAFVDVVPMLLVRP